MDKFARYTLQHVAAIDVFNQPMVTIDTFEIEMKKVCPI